MRKADREFPAAASFLSNLSEQSLQSGNEQGCPRLEAMGLGHTVDLENSFHRRPVTTGNLKKCFATFDLMADHLHSVGHDVAHIDVRPADGMLQRPYPVIAMGDLIHDDAGAAFLDYWVEKLDLR